MPEKESGKVRPEGRRWYQWHAGSVLVSLTVGAAFVLVAVPGSFILGWRLTEGYWSFGWPYAHYMACKGPPGSTADADALRASLEDHWRRETVNGSRRLIAATHSYSFVPTGFWSNPEHWIYASSGSAGRVLWCGLAVNLSLAIGACASLGALVEMRRRRRQRWFQFTTMDLLGLMLITAIGFGVDRYGARQLARDEQTLARLLEKYPGTVRASTFVRTERLWLARLADYRLDQLEWLLHEHGFSSLMRLFQSSQPVRGVAVRGDVPKFPQGVRLDLAPRDMAAELDRLGHLNELQLTSLDDRQMELVDHLRADGITSICFSGCTPPRSLVRFQNLQRLDVADVDLYHLAFPARNLPQLSELIIHYDSLSPEILAWIRQLPGLKVLYLRSVYPVKDLAAIRRQLPGVHVTVDRLQFGGGSFGI